MIYRNYHFALIISLSKHSAHFIVVIQGLAGAMMAILVINVAVTSTAET